MQSSFGEKLRKAFQEYGQLCVGLDPSSEQLSRWGLPDTAAGAESFCLQLLDACENQVGIVKLQVAFFEQYGANGFAALERVLARTGSLGFVVIADAKRGDIGSTMQGYVRAWLVNDSVFNVDAVTLSPFLGVDSLELAVTSANASNKGIFILAATSNFEAKELQSSKNPEGLSVAATVARFASKQNKSSFGSVGLVFGAETDFDFLGIDLFSLTATPILVPGFGAQGAKLADVRRRFGPASDSVICNVSRAIAGASSSGLVERITEAKGELLGALES